MSDDKLKLHIKKSDTETDVITLKELTRSLEGYDEVVIQSVENIVDAGSNVYGAGYQSLVSQIQPTIAFNANTSYSENGQQFLPVGPLTDVIVSDNGLVHVDYYSTGDQVRVFKRNSITDGFQQLFITNVSNNIIANQNQVSVTASNNQFSKFNISKTGRYFAIEDHVNNQVIIYEILNNSFRNIQYVEGNPPTPNILANTSFGSSLSGLIFSDDETSFTLYGSNDVKTYLISDPTTVTQTISENVFPHPISALSIDLNRFIKHDPSNNIIKIFTINSNGTTISSLPINLQGTPIAFDFSKDGTLMAVVTSTFTYIYSYDGSGWRQKSSLFVGLDTFVKFHMSDDGNTLFYVKSELPANRTLIDLYNYENNTWIRIHQENDNTTINSEGMGHVSRNGQHIISLVTGNAAFPKRNIRLKNINTQDLSVVVGVDKDISQVYPKQIRSCKLSLEVIFLDNMNER